MSKEQNLTNMLDTIEQHKYEDLRDQMMNILESAVYRNASGYARNELAKLDVDMQERIASDATPPNEEQLGLLNPTFDVE